MARLDQIAAVGLQEYLVDGTVPVSEVTLAMEGSVVARFYVIDRAAAPISAGPADAAVQVIEEKIEEQARETAASSGMSGARLPVIKGYPVATHAHTVEYRLSDRAALDKLFQSLETALTEWENQTFRP